MCIRDSLRRKSLQIGQHEDLVSEVIRKFHEALKAMDEDPNLRWAMSSITMYQLFERIVFAERSAAAAENNQQFAAFQLATSLSLSIGPSFIYIQQNRKSNSIK
eukprot:TRINITY_DN13858_c0_g1_i2.p1 TRINITY_DN13858_c0_g1~~TRINITY_DN13858_c0_g1_i2.p1  ORF type:complete len:104 (-),score=16.16 TRINITY_DN13858_c0_g1_i2:164-475(-)